MDTSSNSTTVVGDGVDILPPYIEDDDIRKFEPDDERVRKIQFLISTAASLVVLAAYLRGRD